jgi:hypothetical protein
MKSTQDYKKVLVSFVQVVLFLFLAFGGFLKKVAPPDETSPSYHVGVLSFLVLIMLLIVSAVARRAPGPKYRRAWLSAGVVCFVLAIPSALVYPRMLHKYTYPSPENPSRLRVKGSDTDLQKIAKEWVQEQPLEPDASDLVRKFPPGQVWTKESIEHATTILLVSYGSLVLSLATAIFCLIEANADARLSPSAEDTKTKKAI